MDEPSMPLLAARRSAIFDRWFQLVSESYPAGVARFLASEKDRFANPVGATLRRELDNLLDGVLAGKTADELAGPLDEIVRIRAVQDFAPSQAVGFVFLLKKAARQQAGDRPSPEVSHELAELDARVDDLVGRAFDIYMARREKIYELRANEIRNRAFKLLERLQDDGGEDES